MTTNGVVDEVAATDRMERFDVVVVGAGFAGMYLLHRLRNLGLSAVVLEAADDVGGTWYWNRYPGARCDIASIDYSYSFDPDLEREWSWSEKYATQPEILRYAQFVADRYQLRSDIRFETRVTAARWQDDDSQWSIATDGGGRLTARHFVMATGCLSHPKAVDIDGLDRFDGEVYNTTTWPHHDVDLSGKRVAVIGTGSSGIQSIPVMAAQCDAMTVFQRTPNYSVPAHNGAAPAYKVDQFNDDPAKYREDARWSRGGVPVDPAEEASWMLPPDEHQRRLDKAYAEGELFSILNIFADQGISKEANDVVADFIRTKIRDIVDDPVTADLLCPTDHPFGTKRPCLDSGYYETFNLPHVDLVDLRSNPITTITETGVETATGHLDFDVIVFATGFDGMTGAIVNVDIEGRDGLALKQKWADGPLTYLGLMVRGFPNFFAITGPGSPSVLSNMMVSIEQHVDWVADCVADLRDGGHVAIEPTPTAEAGWVQHVNDCADITLHPLANSWYMGANVPGKPRVFLPYIGGVGAYRQACDEVVERGYLGFERRVDGGGVDCNDGVIREMQPDVAMVLEFMAELGLPPIDSMPPADARDFMTQANAARPPGPEVGEMLDGQLPGADGPLDYRLYRPAGDGPHPVTVYFHGGGWVLGDQVSDEPLCRDLCVRSESIIVSVNYRHAPEDRFPAAAEDAYAALCWVAENAEALGGSPGPVAVSGWSAGGNVATVACHLARDRGGPAVSGQLLLTPVTDADPSRPSFTENAEGYVLTRALMDWFWGHYADEAERLDPRAAPIRGNLADLPPAVLVTADFDPLRDEGQAYVEALKAAGSEATHIRARGHTHTSIPAVDVVISGAPIRAEMAASLRRFHSAALRAG